MVELRSLEEKDDGPMSSAAWRPPIPVKAEASSPPGSERKRRKSPQTLQAPALAGMSGPDAS